jgi:hypothetical protein
MPPTELRSDGINNSRYIMLMHASIFRYQKYQGNRKPSSQPPSLSSHYMQVLSPLANYGPASGHYLLVSNMNVFRHILVSILAESK